MKKLFLLFVFVLIVLQIRLWSPDGGVSEWLRLQNELAIAQAKVKALEERNESLKNVVIDLQSQTSVIETQAREVLHYVAPNETFYRVIAIPKDKPESYVPKLPRTRLSTQEAELPAAEATAEVP